MYTILLTLMAFVFGTHNEAVRTETNLRNLRISEREKCYRNCEIAFQYLSKRERMALGHVRYIVMELMPKMSWNEAVAHILEDLEYRSKQPSSAIPPYWREVTMSLYDK